MDIKAVKNRVDATVKKFLEDYATAADASYTDYVRSLPPGAQLPRKNIIYGNEARARFAERAATYQAAAAAELERAAATLRQEKAAPPSVDAVNTLSTLAMLTSVSADDLAAVAERIGGNYLTYHALSEIADKHRIEFDPFHDLDRAQAELDALKRTVSQMNIRAAESGDISQTRLNFASWAADQF